MSIETLVGILIVVPIFYLIGKWFEDSDKNQPNENFKDKILDALGGAFFIFLVLGILLSPLFF